MKPGGDTEIEDNPKAHGKHTKPRKDLAVETIHHTDGTTQKAFLEHASETGSVVVYQGRTPDTKQKGKRG